MHADESGFGEIECCPHCAWAVVETLQAAGIACEADAPGVSGAASGCDQDAGFSR